MLPSATMPLQPSTTPGSVPSPYPSIDNGVEGWDINKYSLLLGEFSMEMFFMPPWQEIPVQLLPGLDYMAIYNNIFLASDGSALFRTPRTNLYYRLPFRLIRVYDMFTSHDYLVINENGDFLVLRFTDQGSVHVEHIMPGLSFRAMSPKANDNATLAVQAITTDGEVWHIDMSRLGSESSIIASEPLKIQGLQHITALVSGELSVALDREGRLWQWGRDNTVYDNDENYRGQIIENAIMVEGLPKMKSITGDMVTIYASAEDGSLWMRGYDRYALLVDQPARFLAEKPGPGMIRFYPFYNWSQVKLMEGNAIELIDCTNSYLHLRIDGLDTTRYIEMTGFRDDDYFSCDDSAYIITPEQIALGKVFYTFVGLAQDTPLFYPEDLPLNIPIQFNGSQVSEVWTPSMTDLWTDGFSKIVVDDDIRVSLYRMRDRKELTFSIEGASRVVVNIYCYYKSWVYGELMPYGFYIIDDQGQIWMISDYE